MDRKPVITTLLYCFLIISAGILYSGPALSEMVPPAVMDNYVTNNTTVQPDVNNETLAANDPLAVYMPSNVRLPLMATAFLAAQICYILFKLINL